MRFLRTIISLKTSQNGGNPIYTTNTTTATITITTTNTTKMCGCGGLFSLAVRLLTKSRSGEQAPLLPAASPPPTALATPTSPPPSPPPPSPQPTAPMAIPGGEAGEGEDLGGFRVGALPRNIGQQLMFEWAEGLN
ncbi:hypothetical protein B0A50_00507 [Salinomyces thailandicus]|uniref:Uncharacterized protein n=1 Tax=Salinomyces thailandicus TaxID=706561 RepID=A0A4U0UDS4_9PEZI|nr:hypothetical protein B0A50_00507 [Salinomyces thailandica]